MNDYKRETDPQRDEDYNHETPWSDAEMRAALAAKGSMKWTPHEPVDWLALVATFAILLSAVAGAYKIVTALPVWPGLPVAGVWLALCHWLARKAE